jgi:2,3-bisphosphoglycerate-independent phosphoglycerate mutase
MESLDTALSRLVKGVLARDGVCLVTADHGNCEQMGERDKKTGLPLVGTSPEGFVPNTSHSRFPVPVALAAKQIDAYRWVPSETERSLASVSATCMNLLGFEAPEGYLPGFIDAR